MPRDNPFHCSTGTSLLSEWKQKWFGKILALLEYIWNTSQHNIVLRALNTYKCHDNTQCTRSTYIKVNEMKVNQTTWTYARISKDANTQLKFGSPVTSHIQDQVILRFESPSRLRSIDTAHFTEERHAKHAPTTLLATTNPTNRHEKLPSSQGPQSWATAHT